MLTTHLRLLLGLGMSGAIPLLPLYVFKVCKGTNLPAGLLVGFGHGMAPEFQDPSATEYEYYDIHSYSTFFHILTFFHIPLVLFCIIVYNVACFVCFCLIL
jgi:hypothetical protein